MGKVSLALLVVLIMGCAPSNQYLLGQGFYSEKFAKVQVQAAANAGKVKSLGKFSVDSSSCGNYSRSTADVNLVIPAIQGKLKELGGNVVDNISANESGGDFMLGLLVIPALLGCSNWTLGGEALLVDEVLLGPK